MTMQSVCWEYPSSSINRVDRMAAHPFASRPTERPESQVAPRLLAVKRTENTCLALGFGAPQLAALPTSR